MRSFSIPLPTLLSGFVAVLVGYASSAAIIWQAAVAAGASTAQIAGWMSALGLAMGASTLILTLWYRAPVLTAWSTPGAALLVTGLQGLTLPEAIGVHHRQRADRLVRRDRIIRSPDAGHPSFAGGGHAGRDFAPLWLTGICQSQ